MTGHPPWCDGTDGGSVHGSPLAVIDCPVTIDGHGVTVVVTVQLVDAGGGPAVYVHGARVEAHETKTLARTLAALGHAELAATVRRLGELAEAGAEFTPMADDRIVNPTTHRLEHLPAVTA